MFFYNIKLLFHVFSCDSPHTLAPILTEKYVKDVIYVDKRVKMFNDSMKASSIHRDKATCTVVDYWTRRLFCGMTKATGAQVISEAQLIPAVKGHDYSDFGVAAGFISELDVSSSRNFVPLCGNLGAVGTCHHMLDSYHLSLMWNPLERYYYIYVAEGFRKEEDCLHGKILTGIPADAQPYRRVLAARACQVGLRCFDETLLSSPHLSLAQDTQSERSEDDSPDDSSDENADADLPYESDLNACASASTGCGCGCECTRSKVDIESGAAGIGTSGNARVTSK